MASRDALLDPGSVSPLATAPRRYGRRSAAQQQPLGLALGLFFGQLAAAAVYTALAFLLPPRVDWLSEAAHVAALHGLLFVVVGLLWTGLRGLDYSALPRGFPLTLGVAEMPAFVTVLANALLLVCLGVESWLATESARDHFSVLNVVQALAVAELVFMGVPGAWVALRLVRGGGGGADVEAGDDSDGTAARGRGKRAAGEGAAFAAVDVGSLAALRLPSSGGAASGALQQRVEQLEAKETELLRQMQRLAGELAAAFQQGAGAAAGSAGGTPSVSGSINTGSPGEPAGGAATPSPLELAGVVQSLTQELERTVSAQRQAAATTAALEERLAWYESELRRASGDVQRLRSALKDEKKKVDKLYATLECEREANAQAQAVISDLRNRLVTSADAGGIGAASGGGLAGSMPAGGGTSLLGSSYLAPAQLGTSLTAAAGGLLRTASLAGRASFAAMSSPGPVRTMSRASMAAPSGGMASPPPSARELLHSPASARQAQPNL